MVAVKQIPAEANLTFADANAFTLTVAVTDNGVAWDPTGKTAVATVVKSDGTSSGVTPTVATSSGSVSVSFTAAQATSLRALGAGLRWYLTVTTSGNALDWIGGQVNVLTKGVAAAGSVSVSLAITNTTITLSTSSLVAPAAANISVADAGSYYTTTPKTVESALQNAGAKLATQAAAGGITFTPGSSGYASTDVNSALVESSTLFHPRMILRSAGSYLACVGSGLTTVTGSLGTFTLANFIVPVGGLTFDRISCEVTTAAAGATPRLGIYAATSGGLPGSLVLDAGQIDASTIGLKEITISQTLSGGRYFLMAAQQGSATCTFRAVNGGDPNITLTGTVLTMISAAVNGYQASGTTTTGALPGTCPATQLSGSNAKIIMRMA